MKKTLFQKVGVGILSIALIMVNSPFQGKIAVKAEGSPEIPVAADVETKTGSIVVNGDDIRTENVNGLTYKGFGLLSGNSTSDLLMDYKAENPESYAELLQILFGGQYPIMNHVKMEMGNDRNNSTGPESATKRSKTEKANVLRNPGWQLAADAKKINPDIKVSILRWKKPVWVSTDEDIYAWYKESILDAYEKYGYMVDYINPNVNEHWGAGEDVAFTKKFAKWIAEETIESIPDENALELFRKIKLVVSDESGTVSNGVVESMKEDEAFYNAVDVVGYHYSPWDDGNGGMKWLAEDEDKEVWNSEAQATFSNTAFRPSNNVQDPSVIGTGIGGTGSCLEMGNTFIKGFVESRRSHVIYQPAIGSFYEGGQYSFKELVSARDPWSGWIHYDAGLLVLAHVSKFAVTGWENETNTAGIWRAIPEASKCDAEGTNPVIGRNGGENYMTLAAPTKEDFSTLIVNDSEYPMEYTLKTENMNLKENQQLEVWETRAADDGAFNENYMKCIDTLSQNEQGEYTIEVKPYSVVTVTTLDVSKSEEHTKALPVEGERTVLDTDSTGSVQDTTSKYLYADDFEYTGKMVKVLDGEGGLTQETEDYIVSRGGDTGAMARYTHTVNGAFEVYKTETGNHVLRQQLDENEHGVGESWNNGDPVTLIGDFRWTNYAVSTDILFETNSNTAYAVIGIRQTGGSHDLLESSGYALKVYSDGKWRLYKKTMRIGSGVCDDSEFQSGANQWNNIKLKGAGNIINAYINDVLVCSYADKTPITAGRVALGSSFTFTQFDNLEVTKIKNTVPYYTELLDDMETYDLSQQRNVKLQYNDKWSHANGKGMYVYQRSISSSTQAGATLSYKFTGTGLEILGVNTMDCSVQATVDGEKMESQAIQRSSNMNMTFAVAGLEYGEHTITIEVLEGTLSVDMVGILGDICQDGEDPAIPPASPTPLPTSSPTLPTDSSPTSTPTPLPDTNTPVIDNPVKVGSTYKIAGANYKVTDVEGKTVEYKGPVGTTAKTVTVPDTVKIQVNGEDTNFKVTAISAKAFTKSKKLKKIVIGKNIKTIGEDAFRNCKNLKKIVIHSTVLTRVGKNAIKGIHKNAVISCKKNKWKAYKKLFSKKTGFKKTMKVKKG